MAATATTREGTMGGKVVATPPPIRGQEPDTTSAPAVSPAVGADADASPVIHEMNGAPRALADQRTQARIIAVLGSADAIRAGARYVYALVTDGVVTLFGAVRSRDAAHEIARMVQAGAGIDAIVNEIQTLGPRVGD